jgi:hypothetical protein
MVWLVPQLMHRTMLDPMHIDPKSTVADYPVLLIRQALRKLREIDTWDSGCWRQLQACRLEQVCNSRELSPLRD